MDGRCSHVLYGAAIVVMHRDGVEIEVFHATQVDRRHCIALGVGAFAIGMDTASRAELVLDHVLVEGVRADRAFRRLQTQLVARDEPQQRTLARADGTIASERAVDFSFDFKGDLAAMAASLVEHEISPLIKDWPEEAPFIANDATSIFSIFECSQTVRIVLRFCTVFLIQRQTWKREQRKSDIVGAFGRQKVSMVLAAKFFDQRNPELSVMLKFLELVWINYVFEVAGNHIF